MSNPDYRNAWLRAEQTIRELEAALADTREALRPFVEYDFHAADYLADNSDARVFPARVVETLIGHQAIARRALAAPQEPPAADDNVQVTTTRPAPLIPPGSVAHITLPAEDGAM